MSQRSSAAHSRRLRALAVGLGAVPVGVGSAVDLDDLEERLKQAQAVAAEAQKRVAALTAERDSALGKPTPLEQYMLDKDGYIVLESALSPVEVDACNACLDTIPWEPGTDRTLQPGDWWGGVQAHNYGAGGFWKDGINLQQIYEAGSSFEALIDHPSWFGRVKHFINSTDGGFDTVHGPVFIDENLANFRGPGEAIGIHSGGQGLARNAYHYQAGRFMAMQVNVLIALTDIGEGDGGTMLIPGSHKSNVPHPGAGDENNIRDVLKRGEGLAADSYPGAIEVFMKAGDALLFSDAIAHGSARRVNDGYRRICVMRYMPSWANFRMPYRPTPALLERLTPQQRQVVCPLNFNLLAREPQRKDHPNVGAEIPLSQERHAGGRVKGWV